MLGYIVSQKSELKVREAELYKAYYCGVCKSIGKHYGQLPRMILSYDSAFLAVLMDCVIEDKEEIKRQRCISGIIRKKPVAFSKGIDFSADMMLCLSWFKILDDINDENSTFAKGLKKAYKGSFNRIEKKYSELVKKIGKHIDRLGELEKNQETVLDEVADCFAQIMKDIFQMGYEYVSEKPSKINSKAIGELGYHIGRWVYLIDALDDLEDNIENGSYNPIVSRFEYKNQGYEEFKKAIADKMKQILIISLDRAGKALDLIDIKKNREILENIIYVGMLHKTEEIVNK